MRPYIFTVTSLIYIISIHAPVWGATFRRKNNYSQQDANFNPRTRMGCDLNALASLFVSWRISIHAPVWGATGGLLLKSQIDYISIHAPVWGATKRSGKKWQYKLKFQSTHPYGVRHLSKYNGKPVI